MATVYASGTNQSKWAYLGPLTSTTGLYDPTYFAHRYNATIWPSDTGNGVYVIPTLAEANSFAMMFFGALNATTPTVGDYADVMIWGVSQIDIAGATLEYIGHYLATLRVHLGSSVSTGGSFGGTARNFADKIDVLDDATNSPPGLRVLGDATGGRAIVLHDSLGFSAYIVQLRRTNATGWAASMGLLTRVV